MGNPQALDCAGLLSQFSFNRADSFEYGGAGVVLFADAVEFNFKQALGIR